MSAPLVGSSISLRGRPSLRFARRCWRRASASTRIRRRSRSGWWWRRRHRPLFPPSLTHCSPSPRQRVWRPACGRHGRRLHWHGLRLRGGVGRSSLRAGGRFLRTTPTRRSCYHSRPTGFELWAAGLVRPSTRLRLQRLGRLLASLMPQSPPRWHRASTSLALRLVTGRTPPRNALLSRLSCWTACRLAPSFGRPSVTPLGTSTACRQCPRATMAIVSSTTSATPTTVGRSTISSLT